MHIVDWNALRCLIKARMTGITNSLEQAIEIYDSKLKSENEMLRFCKSIL